MRNEKQELKHVQNVTNAMLQISRKGNKIIDDVPVNHPTHHVTQILSIPPGGNANRPDIDTVMTSKNELKEMVGYLKTVHVTTNKNKGKHDNTVDAKVAHAKKYNNYDRHEDHDDETHHHTTIYYADGKSDTHSTRKHVTTKQVHTYEDPNDVFPRRPMIMNKLEETTFDRYRRVLKESESFL
jgi:hypothetical protein